MGLTLPWAPPRARTRREATTITWRICSRDLPSVRLPRVTFWGYAGPVKTGRALPPFNALKLSRVTLSRALQVLQAGSTDLARPALREERGACDGDYCGQACWDAWQVSAVLEESRRQGKLCIKRPRHPHLALDAASKGVVRPKPTVAKIKTPASMSCGRLLALDDDCTVLSAVAIGWSIEADSCTGEVADTAVRRLDMKIST